MKDNDTIKKKLEFYREKALKVHVVRKNGIFWNGFIIREEVEGVYIFEDAKLGEQELFVDEVEVVERYFDRGVV